MPHTHLTVFVSTEATLIVTFNIYTDSLSPSSVVSKDDITNPAHALVIREKCVYIFEHALTYYIQQPLMINTRVLSDTASLCML